MLHWLWPTLVYRSATGKFWLNHITASTRFVFAALATARRHDFISSGTARLLLTGTTGTTTIGSTGAACGTACSRTRRGLTARQVFEATVGGRRNSVVRHPSGSSNWLHTWLSGGLDSTGTGGTTGARD